MCVCVYVHVYTCVCMYVGEILCTMFSHIHTSQVHTNMYIHRCKTLQALLTTQLDGLLSAPYMATFVPLHVTILALLVTTLTRQEANPWWFGLHKNFTDFLLDTCPPLQEYANISVSHQDDESISDGSKLGRCGKSKQPPSEKLTVLANDVYPYEDLMMPD